MGLSPRHLCIGLALVAVIITSAMTVSLEPSGASQPVASTNGSPSLKRLPLAGNSANWTRQFNQGRLLRDYGKLPLSFESNQGQTDSRVKFLSRGSGYSLFLTSSEAVLRLHKGDPKAGASARPRSSLRKPPAVADSVVRIKLVGADAEAKVTELDQLAGKSNYFIGNDPKNWRTNVPNYAKVRYANVYRGVDLVYYGNQRQLEYDFVLAPKAEPRQIQLSFSGANQLRLDPNGNLIVSIAGGEVVEHKPVIYQDIDGMRRQVAGGYELRNGHAVGFKVGRYDGRRSLTTDPGLVYSTYLGGTNDDFGAGIAVDSAGNAYVVGDTSSADFPITPGAFQTALAGSFDVFVTKLNSSGSALVYSTYVGGSSREQVEFGAIALDSAGNAYIAGITDSNDFPTTPGVFQSTYGGNEDAFVTKLNRTGSALVYSTYLGGSSEDDGNAIALDSAGNAYVTGVTLSSNFPITAGAFQTTASFVGGIGNAFVTKLNRSGSALDYSTYLGGSGNGSGGNGIALDSAGNAYVTGATGSSNFPTTAGSFQTSFGGGDTDAFVTKLNRTGSALVYSTYLGGGGTGLGNNGDDGGFGIALDSASNAYVTGFTGSTNFPITAAAFQTTLGGGIDAFVSKLNNSGSALLYSTYLGGGNPDQGNGIALDSAGNAYVTGYTVSSDFPVTAGAFQTTFGGGNLNRDAFMTKLNSTGSALVYSIYLGGSSDDTGIGIVLDLAGNAFVSGYTGSTNFPITAGAFQTTLRGNNDAFVTKFTFGKQNCRGQNQQGNNNCQ